MNQHSNLLEQFLSVLNVKHTHIYTSRLYEEHPHKNNLYGLSSMLQTYGVENVGMRLEDKSQIKELEAPFIAYMGGDFVLVTAMSENKTHYSWRGKQVAIATTQFIESWSGVVLVAEPNEQSGEPGYAKNRKEEWIQRGFQYVLGAVIGVGLGLVFYSSTQWENPFSIIPVGLTLFGLFISYLLLEKQLHAESSYADKLCSLFSKSDCNNVLEGEASRFMGLFSWSEAGFGYFFSLLLIQVLYPSLIPYAAWMNVCALPYTVWSVWYQRTKARQWCPLCLMVVSTFWFLLIGFFVCGNLTLPSFQTMELITVLILYLFPFLVTQQLMPILAKAGKLQQTTYEMNSIKLNEEVFIALLKKQPRYEVSKETSKILFGNNDSKTLITVLTNPHCEPCAKMHQRIEQFVKQVGDRYCVQYIFSSFDSSLDISNKALIAVCMQYTGEEQTKLLNEWFSVGKRNKEEFIARYRLCTEVNEIEEEFSKHEAWKTSTQLRATPTILVNGYSLPEQYKVEDLLQMEL